MAAGFSLPGFMPAKFRPDLRQISGNPVLAIGPPAANIVTFAQHAAVIMAHNPLHEALLVDWLAGSGKGRC